MRRTRWWPPWGRTAAFAVAGAALALALAARVDATVGPFECTVSARPSLHGNTLVRLAPLGTIQLDTHTGPVAVELRVDELRPDDAERIAADPGSLDGLEDELAADARAALVALARQALLAAVVGGIGGALVARFHWRSAAIGVAVGSLLVGAVGGAAAASFRPEAVAEPRYSGLLTIAPRAVGDVAAIVERFDDYRAQLSDLVANVAGLYRAAEGLPDLAASPDDVRLLHVSDVHNNPQGYDLAAQIAEQFDVAAVVDTGDSTDWGTSAESELLDRIGTAGVPWVWVRGNHDSHRTQRAVAAQPDAVVLDGNVAEVAGLRIWGIGDPRYTPDKDQPVGVDVEVARIEAFATDVEEEVRRDNPARIDVVAVHDARAAASLGDLVPLVLAGHTHSARERRVGETLVLVEGSTGGAGLRGFRAEDAEPLTCSVLHFDRRSGRLVAYDRVTVERLGAASVRIERHVVEPDE